MEKRSLTDARQLARTFQPRIEALEPRRLLASDLVITEFMAKNDGFLEDGNGNSPDWVEIHNQGRTPIDLAGYRLTDTPRNLSRWTFPSVNLDPGGYLVVFASGNDASDAEGNLHTNFSLSASGEYLALIAPDGSPLSEFGDAQTDYPPQAANVSFGVAQQEIFVDSQSSATHWIPTDGSVDAIWKEPGFDALAHGFVSGKAALGYESNPDSRLSFSDAFLTALPPDPLGVYERVEFEVNNLNLSTLTLRLKYEDGFIAYLNGVEVARENAPVVAHWLSGASTRHSDRRSLEFEEFDISEHATQLTEGTNVLAIHGLNHHGDRGDMLLVPELIASVNSPDKRIGYMNSPTPGSANVSDESVFLGILGPTTIEGEPGFYDAPFTVTLSTETPDAEIRFTTDGSPPTETTGTAYTGPIQIEATTTLRAAAFADNLIPSNIATQTYLFLEQVIRQPQDQPNLPAEWLWTEDRNLYTADYGMDPRIVDDPAYRDQIVDSLKSLRTMSVVMDPDELFGPEGMHNNTELHGRESEHPMSLEILNPDGSLAHQVDAGIRIHGNFTRHYNVTMKQSFRLTFRSEYGTTNLEYPLFPDSEAEAFDNVILHAGKIRDDAQLVSNSFGRDTNLAMGNLDAHSTHVHLYLNGLYWGVYNPMERPDGQFGETYLGGRDSDYDSILNNSEAVDGSARRFTRVMRSIRDLDTREAYEDFLKQVDLDNLLDFLLINLYMAHGEHEFRALGKKEGDADYRFFIWDVDEMAMRSARAREDIDTYFTTGVWEAIIEHPEIRMRFADRIRKHLFDDGALTPESAQSRWEARTEEIRLAVIAESARWGDMRWENVVPRRLYTLEDFDRFGERLAETFFPERTANLLDQMTRRWDVYPTVAPPDWNQFGGPVSADFQLSMTNPNEAGTILYTLDGTDPRVYGGEAAPTAVTHDGSPISIAEITVVRARVLSNGEWSALTEASFSVSGDLNGDGNVNLDDIDSLCTGIHDGESRFDWNQDGRLDEGDLANFVQNTFHTDLGDANLDGRFNSQDLLQVSNAGELDDGVDGNSTWAEGDWNCDRDFTTQDLVLAFRTGDFVSAAHPTVHLASSPVAALIATESVFEFKSQRTIGDDDGSSVFRHHLRAEPDLLREATRMGPPVANRPSFQTRNESVPDSIFEQADELAALLEPRLSFEL